ncbi:hypothetical protein TNCV_1225311 [Trichonephila clavipes]|nr:hypothetical protein TNCV_1225311 [Trichonephila clavipes]
MSSSALCEALQRVVGPKFIHVDDNTCSNRLVDENLGLKIFRGRVPDLWRCLEQQMQFTSILSELRNEPAKGVGFFVPNPPKQPRTQLEISLRELHCCQGDHTLY